MSFSPPITTQIPKSLSVTHHKCLTCDAPRHTPAHSRDGPPIISNTAPASVATCANVICKCAAAAGARKVKVSADSGDIKCWQQGALHPPRPAIGVDLTLPQRTACEGQVSEQQLTNTPRFTTVNKQLRQLKPVLSLGADEVVTGLEHFLSSLPTWHCMSSSKNSKSLKHTPMHAELPYSFCTSIQAHSRQKQCTRMNVGACSLLFSILGEELPYVTSVSGAGCWVRVKDHCARAICQAGWVQRK